MNEVILLISICLCLFCQSCQRNDIDATAEIKDELYINPEGSLLDGGQISDIGLYCIENNRSGMGGLWFEYYPTIKTVQGYDMFKLYLMLNRNAPRYVSNDKIEMASISKMEIEYQRERAAFISDSYHKYLQEASTGWPDLFTAFINGEFSITCDKILFGEQPGANLVSYFSVFSASPCVPIGIENPNFLYNFGEDKPTKAAELFVEDTWLQPKYVLEFSKLPDEKYEELTLSISLPMTIEHIRHIVVSKYKGIEIGQKFADVVFDSKCQIKFNWN